MKKRCGRFLRKKKRIIDERVERELRKHIPAYVSVQADIEFEQGSVILAGAITLLSWGESIVFDAAKEEIAQQLSELVKAAVRRAIDYVSSTFPASVAGIGHIDMNVTARAPSSGALLVRPAASSVAEPSSRELVRTYTPIAYGGLILGMVVLFVIDLLLLVDRFFVIHPK